MARHIHNIGLYDDARIKEGCVKKGRIHRPLIFFAASEAWHRVSLCCEGLDTPDAHASRLDMVRAGFEAIRTAAVDESNQSAGDVNDAFGKLGTISRTLTCGLAMGCREHYRL
jgi:hypothetical protein